MNHAKLMGFGVWVFAAACAQDFDQFRPQPGSGGAGGEGGGDLCAEVDCNDNNPCTEDICQSIDGTCVHPAAAVFTVPQVPGDCRNATCSEGVVVPEFDLDDVPDDQNPCTVGACSEEGNPRQDPLNGTECNDGGTCVEGVCSACETAEQCGKNGTCVTYACDNNTCAIEYHGGTSVDGANAGDCQRRVCVDGEPSPQLVADDTDPPGDQGSCITETCTDGVPSVSDTPADTFCDGTSGQCDGSGSCVGCTNDLGCAGGPTPVCGPDNLCVECINALDCSGNDRACLDGECVGCVKNGDCQNGGVCDGATNTCVECNGSGGCLDPLVCLDQTCVQCIGDGDCPGGVCNANNVCVGCEVDGDCGADVCCDAVDGCAIAECVECTDDQHCIGNPAGEICCLLGDSCPINTCAECGRNADCAGNPNGTICDPATDTCVECVVANDCPGVINDACVGNQCVECTTENQCGDNPGETHCLVADNNCVECLTSPQCLTPARPACDVDTNLCVECLDVNDCDLNPNGGVCQASNVCGCNGPGDCSNGRYCPLSGLCAACTLDAQCAGHPDGNLCRNGACSSCAEDADCASHPDGNVCDSVTSTCVPCSDNTDCAANPEGLVCRANGDCGCNNNSQCLNSLTCNGATFTCQ